MDTVNAKKRWKKVLKKNVVECAKEVCGVSKRKHGSNVIGGIRK
jgi:hypothetical protein